MALDDAVPSSAFDVVKRNAEDLDKLVDQTSGYVTSRTGKSLIPWQVAIQRYAAFNNRGAWATATDYSVNDVWSDSGSWYLVLSPYTSGASAAADIAAGNVKLWQDARFSTYDPATDAEMIAGTANKLPDAEQVRREHVAQVPTIAALSALESAFDGQAVAVTSYHGGWAASALAVPSGGGVYIYDANRAKADHDGGLVISATVPWVSDMSLYLNASGETDPFGSGCWVLKRTGGQVSIDSFGAIPGNPAVDNSASMNKCNLSCWNAGLAMFVGGVADYYIASQLTENKARIVGVQKRSYGTETFIGGESNRTLYPSASVIRAAVGYAGWMISVPDDQRQFRMTDITIQGNGSCNGLQINNRNRENELHQVDVKFVQNGIQIGDAWVTRLQHVTVSASDVCFDFAGGGTTFELDTCIAEGDKLNSLRANTAFLFSETLYSGGSQTFRMVNCAAQYCVDAMSIRRDQKIQLDNFNLEDWTRAAFNITSSWNYGSLVVTNMRIGSGSAQSIIRVDGDIDDTRIVFNSFSMFTNTSLKFTDYSSGTVGLRFYIEMPDYLYDWLKNDRAVLFDGNLSSNLVLSTTVKSSDMGARILVLNGSASYTLSQSDLRALLSNNGISNASDILLYGNGSVFSISSSNAGANICAGYFSVRYSTDVFTFNKHVTGANDVAVTYNSGTQEITVTPTSSSTYVMISVGA